MGGRGSSYGLDDSSRSDGGVREPSDYEDVKNQTIHLKRLKLIKASLTK